MPDPVSAANAEHYTWTGAEGYACDAWYLVRTPTLNIIEELMPAGAAETPHHHTHARQFFYVLSGELTLLVGGQPHTIPAREGLEIAPGEVHQAINRSSTEVRFLITSNPPSHADRTDVSPAP